MSRLIATHIPSWKEALAQGLWAAIDDLDDSDGFVLVACTDGITFTRLKAAGWGGDHELEIEPLDLAVERRESEYLGTRNRDLAKKNAELDKQIAAKQQRLDDLNAAIANALGRETPA